MRDLFSDNNSGYRLKTLQLFNWGVFDKKVETLFFDSKSTILTGLNGSGKTTTVDAILTLLIPYNLRFYNLSSESNKKRERDEENYTLGAIGSKADGEGSVKEYLRKKNEVISIINGIFFEPVSEKYLSLLQVRYFSGEDLKCLKIITEKELLIEDIESILAKNNTRISQNAKWVRFITEAYSSRLFDSFAQYKNFFMEKFGLQSDNALKLFGQTVGLKVLGDVTTFIRQYMLSDKSPISEYETLNNEFSNLTEIDRKIRQIKKQIEMLSKTISIGDEFTQKEVKLNSLRDCLEGLEGWFILHSLRLSEEEIKETENEVLAISSSINDNEKEQRRLRELELSLSSSNKIAETIREYERIIERLTLEEESKHNRLKEYQNILFRLKSNSVSLSFENTSDDFFNIKNDTPSLIDKYEEENILNEKNREEIIKTIALIDSDITQIKEELASLEQRDNNIPKELIKLREMIANETDVSISNLPFLGELIRVKESEKEWENTLESLLEPYALSLLVAPDDFDKVLGFLNSTDLNGKIGIIKREKNLVLERKESLLLEKIEIKDEKKELQQWLKDYLGETINYSFSQNINTFKTEEYSLLKNNLVKNENYILKNDTKDPLTKKNNHYLGWSNKNRIEELHLDLSNLEDEKYSEEETKRRYERIIKQNSYIIRDLDSLKNFESFDDIDIASVRLSLNEKIKEKEEFIKQNPSYLDIENKLQEIRLNINKLSNEKDQLIKEKTEKEIRLRNAKDTYSKLSENKEKSENKVAIETFVSSYSSLLKYTCLDELRELYSKLFDSLRREKENNENAYYALREALISSMKDFINPPLSIKQDISWRGEFPSLIADPAYYSDFKNLYIELKDNDLSQYTDDFNNYLEQSLSNVIGTLAEALNSWDKEIINAIRILNRNLQIIPFNKEKKTHLRLEAKNLNDKDYIVFSRMLRTAIPDRIKLRNSNEDEKKSIYNEIKAFLDKYNNDTILRRKVLDLRNKYRFIVYEDTAMENVRIYSDTASLSGGEKAKLTFTILASALSYQYGLDREDEKTKGPFRFVILDEAFSKSDNLNSEYALSLFKELDLQLMVVTPRNGINLVEGYVSSLHLIEKKANSNTSTISSMTIEEYREIDNGIQ